MTKMFFSEFSKKYIIYEEVFYAGCVSSELYIDMFCWDCLKIQKW